MSKRAVQHTHTQHTLTHYNIYPGIHMFNIRRLVPAHSPSHIHTCIDTACVLTQYELNIHLLVSLVYDPSIAVLTFLCDE